MMVLNCTEDFTSILRLVKMGGQNAREMRCLVDIFKKITQNSYIIDWHHSKIQLLRCDTNHHNPLKGNVSIRTNALHAITHMLVLAACTSPPCGSRFASALSGDRVTGDRQWTVWITLTFLAGPSWSSWVTGVARGTSRHYKYQHRFVLLRMQCIIFILSAVGKTIPSWAPKSTSLGIFWGTLWTNIYLCNGEICIPPDQLIIGTTL